VTTGSAADCAQFKNSDGDIKSTVDYATCKTESDCTNSKNSCGGYSSDQLIPGEWCSAKSVAKVCCIPGKCGKGGECAQGTNADGSPFDSSTWLECKFEAGCGNSENDCGGFGKAGEWCDVSGTSSPTPVPGTAPTTEKKESSGMSTGVVVGIAIGAMAVVGIGFMAMSGGNKEQDASKYQLQEQLEGGHPEYEKL